MNKTQCLIFTLTMLFLLSCEKSDEMPTQKTFIVNDSISIDIEPFFDGKSCAICLTFDDGIFEHFTVASDQLHNRRLRGTFFINGKYIASDSSNNGNYPNVAMIRHAASLGHEISSHTWSHTDLTSLSLTECFRELERNDSAIYEWTGVRPVTFSFPFNNRTTSLCQMLTTGRVGARMSETSFGQTVNHSTFESMKSWVKQCRMNKRWGCAVYHGMNKGYDSWENISELYEFWDWIKVQEDVWTATFREVCAYIKEREDASISAIVCNDVLSVHINSKLDDSLFDMPLTLTIHINDDTLKVNAKINSAIKIDI